MMGRSDRDQRQLFYEFSLDEMIPKVHLLRRINVFATAILPNAGSTPPSVFARLSKVQSVDQRIAQPDSCTGSESSGRVRQLFDFAGFLQFFIPRVQTSWALSWEF
jgi:hypothetical protein